MNFSRFSAESNKRDQKANGFFPSIKLLFKTPAITTIFWMMLTFSFFMAAYQVLYPFLLLEHYHVSTITFGVVTSTMGVVAILGSILPFFARSTHSLKIINACTIAFGLAFIVLAGLLFLSPSIPFTLITFVIIGSIHAFINSLIEPLSYAYVQRNTPQQWIGSLTTVYYTLLELMTPLATLLASVLILYISDYYLFLLFGLLILTIVCIISSQQRAK